MSMSKWLWGGLGWAMFGPIGGILGYAMASMSDKPRQQMHASQQKYPNTKAGDFGLSLLVLFGAAMKADNQVLKAELDYVKQFFVQQFGQQYAKERILLFKEIIKQDYPLKDVCHQIKHHMDHPARLELVHILFGLSQADGHVHPNEVRVIKSISGYLGISSQDYESLQAMFHSDTASCYKVLEINESATVNEIKKAYRKMATKYHPDKVHHLGEDFQKFAEEKFKKVNDAYEKIKKEHGFV